MPYNNIVPSGIARAAVPSIHAALHSSDLPEWAIDNAIFTTAVDDHSSDDWRNQLPQLDGLPLIPCGAGPKGKAPIDHRTAQPLSNWQQASFSPVEIADMGDAALCVGFRPGPDADHFLVLDLDGQSALDLCESRGCSLDDIGWVVRRTTCTDRLKVVVHVPEHLRQFLQSADGSPVGHISKTTKAATALPNGERFPAEQVELFYGTGQCIVLGQHKASGGAYVWEGSPISVKGPSPEWWGLIIELVEQCISKNGTAQLAPVLSTQLVHSGPNSPCPICGRDTSSACTTYVSDGRRRVNCHQGQTFSPPTGLKRGETIQRNGTEWAFCGEGFNASIGSFSTFAEHIPASDGTETHGNSETLDRLQASGQRAEGRRFFHLEGILPADLAQAAQLVTAPHPIDDLGRLVMLLSGFSGLLKLGNRVSSSMHHSVPMNLFVVMGARSGMVKTPAQKALVLDPAAPLRKDLAAAHKRKVEDWQRENKGKPKADRTPHPRPLFPSVNDYTPEALELQLADHESCGLGLLYYKEELSGLFSALLSDSRSGGGRGMSQLLELFDGSGTTSIRVEAGSRQFEQCHFSINGAIQPSVWRKLVNDSADGDDRGQFARFLYCELPPRGLVHNDDDPTPEEQAAYKAAKKCLQDYAERCFKEPPRTYELSQEARRRFHRWEEGYSGKKLTPGCPPTLGAIYGKAAAHALRLAGLIHLVHCLSPDLDSSRSSCISYEHMDVAMAVVDQLFAETIAMYEQAETPDDHLTQSIHRLSWQSKEGTGIPKRLKEVKARLPSKQLRDALTADKFRCLTQVLAEGGYGVVTTKRAPNGKSALKYTAVKELPGS